MKRAYIAAVRQFLDGDINPWMNALQIKYSGVPFVGVEITLSDEGQPTAPFTVLWLDAPDQAGVQNDPEIVPFPLGSYDTPIAALNAADCLAIYQTCADRNISLAGITNNHSLGDLISRIGESITVNFDLTKFPL